MPTGDAILDAITASTPRRARRSMGGLDPMHESLIRSSADEIGVPQDIALRQFSQESGFKNNATSPKGARGIAQFMPATAQRFGVDVNDPVSSINGWKKYMGFLMNRYGGDLNKALAGYNAGEGNVDKYDGIPPFKETQDYVRKIMGGQQQPKTGDVILDAIAAASKGKKGKAQPQPQRSSFGDELTGGAVDVGRGASYSSPTIQSATDAFDTVSRAGIGGNIYSAGVTRGVGKALSTAGSAIRYGVLPLVIADDIRDAATGRDNVRPMAQLAQPLYKANTYLQERANAQSQGTQAVMGTSPIARGIQTAGEGMGAAGVDLPLLIGGGSILGAANLPVQMALGRGQEGQVGMLKGFGEGMVYHFGMGLTAPMGRVANSLFWGGAATAQSLAEGSSLPEAIGFGATMAGMSTMGSERVKVFDPKSGEVRPAQIKDLIAIQRGSWRDGTPVRVAPPDFIQPYLAAMKPLSDYDAQGIMTQANKGPRMAALERANELKAQREAKFKATQPLADQAMEQLKAQVDPFQMKVFQSHLEKLSDEDRLWEVLGIQRQLSKGVPVEQVKLTRGEINEQPLINEKPTTFKLDKQKDEITPSGLRRIEYIATIDDQPVTINASINSEGKASVDMIEGTNRDLGGNAVGTGAMLALRRELLRLHPEVKSIFFERSGSTGGEQTRERILNIFGREKPMEGDRYIPDSDSPDFTPDLEEAKRTEDIANYDLDYALKQNRIPQAVHKILTEENGPGVLTRLKQIPELKRFSPQARAEMAAKTDLGQELLAQAFAPKITGTDFTISDHTLLHDQAALERIASSPEMSQLATHIDDIVERIKGDIGGYSKKFKSVVFGGFDIGSGRYAVNIGGRADGQREMRINIAKTVASIHALHQLEYIKGSEFTEFIAQHVIETIYHEMAHQVDPGHEGVTHEGIEGHSKEFDERYKKLLTLEADNVVKYKQEIQAILEKDNESITNSVGQQALNLGIIRSDASSRGSASDPFVSNIKRRGQFNADTILAATGRGDGTGLGQDSVRLSTDQPASLYPLYKPESRERLIQWAERRKENLDRFMGEQSVFRRENGEYTPLYHGSKEDFTEFKPGDIGIHAGTKEAANYRNAIKEHTYIQAEGYQRMALHPDEVLLGKKSKATSSLVIDKETGKYRIGKEELKAQSGTQILPLYVKLENPVRIDDVDSHDTKAMLKEFQDKGIFTGEEAAEILKKSKESGKIGKKLTEERFEQMRQALEAKGYDGIVYENIFEGGMGKKGTGTDSYVAFRPEQVKSAIGNSGEFDPHDPNILHSMDPVSMAIKGAIETGRMLYKAGTKFVDWSRGMIDHYGPGIKLHLENLWEAVVKMHQNEKGAISLGQSKLINEDIKPGLQKAAVGIQQGWDTILKHFAPAARGIEAQQMAGLTREKNSELWLKFFRAEAALHQARSYLDKLPTQEGFDFIDHIENGRAQADPALQPMADVMTRFLDEARYSVQRLGTGKLSSFYINYFPHIWKDPSLAAQTFQQMFSGKRPLAGKKAFLKGRTHLTFADGMAAGLEPVSNNPVDLVMLKLHEVNKYVMGVSIMNEAKANGWMEFVKAGNIEAKKTAGFAEINDSIATVFGGGSARPQGGQLIRGKYMAPEQAARVLNNYLSPGLRQNAAFRGYMSLANTLNQAQLGISLFHAGFTTIDAMTSKLALGVRYAGMAVEGSQGGISRGEAVLKAGTTLVRANPLTAWVENVYKGNKVLKESLRPGSTNQRYADIVKNLTAAGYRPKMEKVYTNDMAQKFLQRWRQSNSLEKLGDPILGLKAIGAGIELAARPILEQLVPRQKLGVAADLIQFELDKNPNMSIIEKRASLGKAWDSVDNRLGQMTYDNLFWNRTAKDLAMFSTRSVGWNLGTFREIGGGLYDTAATPVELYKRMTGAGKGRDLVTNRMAYSLVALPVYTALLGAITQYLYTGSGPKEPKDYFFPRTGQVDERGNPERVNLPTYIKDVYHYGTHPVKTATSKIHPALSMVYDMITNEDYYGTEIYGPDDPKSQQAKDMALFMAKQIVPFGIQNFAKEKERGAGTMKAMVPALTGITPAPSDINQTPAEAELYEYNQRTRPAGTKTKLEADRTQAMHQIRIAIQKNDVARAQKLTNEAMARGVLKQNDLGSIVDDLKNSPLQTRFGPTDPEEAIKAWDLMNDQEKMEVQELMKTKFQQAMDLPPARRDRVMPRFSSAIAYYIQQQRKQSP